MNTTVKNENYVQINIRVGCHHFRNCRRLNRNHRGTIEKSAGLLIQSQTGLPCLFNSSRIICGRAVYIQSGFFTNVSRQNTSAAAAARNPDMVAKNLWQEIESSRYIK